MVAISNPKSWLPDQPLHSTAAATVSILAFEVAAVMARLISLHRSLTDAHLLRLRSDCMRSQGVAYLISTDQAFLLRLACAELMDDLNRAAASITRFSTRCRQQPRFDQLFTNLKSGATDPRYALKGIDKTTKKMERYVTATSKLCEEMEVLAELEAAERKLEQRWSRYSGPIPKTAPPATPNSDSNSFATQMKSQCQKVKRLKEESLWGQSFDRAVTLMAHSACAAFARVCSIFSSYVPGLPVVGRPAQQRSRFWLGKHSSGPLLRRAPPPPPPAEVALRPNSCPIIGTRAAASPPEWGMILKPAARMVGAAGLAERYASVILMAERLLEMREETAAGAEEVAAREEVYEMLPERMRAAVKAKLRAWWRKDAGAYDGELAEGWKEAVGKIMGWLAPVAQDTIQWQAERNMDRRQRFDPQPRVLLLQTLHFADREKTEAAITEVLVALSLVGWYEERRRQSARL